MHDDTSLFNRRQLLGAGLAGVLPNVPLSAHSATSSHSSKTGQRVLRLSHVVAPNTPKGRTLAHFAELVNQYSQGQMQVQVYPQSELFGDNDEMQGLQFGSVHFIAPSLSKFGRVGLPEFELYDLPYAFDNLDQVRRVMHGLLGQMLLDRLQRQGLRGLGYLHNGFKHMSANRALQNATDYQGLRMRIQPSRVLADQMNALQATAVPLSFAETYPGLQEQVVDGTENTASNFWTQGLQRVQSHLSLTSHGYLGYAVITQQRFWENLSGKERELLSQAMRDALQWGNAQALQHEQDSLQALRGNSSLQVYSPSTRQLQGLQKALQPVRTKLVQRIGPVWLDMLDQALQKT